MPVFTYQARDPRGQLITETLTSDDELSLREQLRRSDLYVVDVKVVRTRKRRSVFGSGVSLMELAMMARQLRTVINAGVPLVSGLHALADQAPSPLLSEVLTEVARIVSQGVPVAEAMERFPKIFPPLLVSLVRTGEEGGRLPETLLEATRQFDQQIEIRQRMLNALVYPAFTLVVTVVGVLFMLLFVVPVFDKIYTDMNAELPWMTRSLVDLSQLLVRFGWLLALVVAAGGVLLSRYFKTPEGKVRLDGWKLRLPLFGDLFLKAGSASLVGVLAGLTESGVPVVQALYTASGVCGNEVLAVAARTAASNVEQGRRLSSELQATERFPIMVVRMVAIAEEVGTLPMVLRELAASYNTEVEYAVRRILGLIEPAMVLMIGLVVGYVLIALYFPIFQMSTLITK
jgi:type IV pilus assembly protein PilC